MESRLAIDGGAPIRQVMLPYGRQSVDEDDIAAVVEVLQSDWLTTGPMVDRFEARLAELVGAEEAVVVSSGTAALHAAVDALGVGPGDEVIVPTMTFAASANCVVFSGATPVFADVEPQTLLVDPEDVERKITGRTKAIVTVDYAGQPCDYERLNHIAVERGVSVIADACHALGATYAGKPVGTLASLNVFSMHPVKPITTGEGGAVATDDVSLAERMRRFRNHGIDADHRWRMQEDSWVYNISTLGYNYRLTDLQCALGISQLHRLRSMIQRRQEIAARYDEAAAGLAGVDALAVKADVSHGYHLYVVRVRTQEGAGGRAAVFRALRAEGIGVNVHYIPVHLHSMYRDRFGTGPGDCPVAEAAYEEILSLPIFPAMTDQDVSDVCVALSKVMEALYR